MRTGLFIGPIAATWVSTALAAPAEPDFVEQCVTSLMKDGRPRETADAACDCIAKRTSDRPELREEFLIQIRMPRQPLAKSSPALRQVRAACVPMPIWGLTSAEE